MDALRARFERNTIPEPMSGCLLWLGRYGREGRGLLKIDGRAVMASHVALELAGRKLLPGQCALHHCDNPPCVNEQHLFAGTQADNVADMIAKGRQNYSGLRPGRGHLIHCKHGHPFSGENLRISKRGLRECVQCGRDRARNSARRRRAALVAQEIG